MNIWQKFVNWLTSYLKGYLISSNFNQIKCISPKPIYLESANLYSSITKPQYTD